MYVLYHKIQLFVNSKITKYDIIFWRCNELWHIIQEYVT